MDLIGSEFASGLVDLNGVPMAELDDLPDTVITAVLRRVVGEVRQPVGEPVAEFTSSL